MEFSELAYGTMERPIMTDMMTSRPPAYGVLATWLIHDSNGNDYKLYQAGPTLHPPLDLIRFVHSVASYVREVEEKYDEKDRENALHTGQISLGPVFPSARLRYALDSSVAQAALLGPITRELWYRLPELNISLENFVNSRRPQPPRVAYVWEVWAVERGDLPKSHTHPGCEIAFTAHDKDGAPDPNFTFDRMKPEELVELLEARDLLKKTFKL